MIHGIINHIKKPGIRVKDWSFFWSLVRHPMQFNVHLLDAYVDGALEIDYPLTPIFKKVFRTAKAFHLQQFYYRWMNVYSRADEYTSRHQEDIRHHYDLEMPLAEGKIDATAFYRLWLDKSMTYSMGYWPKGTQTLEQAQQNKRDLYQKLCDIRQGHEVYEPGCGFGSFIPAVLEKEAHWYGVNLSKHQSRWVRKHYPNLQIREQNLMIPWKVGKKIKQFDRIVNIGNLEHIQKLDECAAVFRQMLKKDGKVLVHIITLADNSIGAMTDQWITKQIFPNGQIYSHQRVLEQFGHHFNVDFEHIFPGYHYAKTLHEWHARFEKNLTKIQAMGAPPNFIRLWRIWLATCEALFDSGVLQNSVIIFVPKSHRRKSSKY